MHAIQYAHLKGVRRTRSKAVCCNVKYFGCQLLLFCPETEPKTISEGLKSQIFLEEGGGACPHTPLAVHFMRSVETYATGNPLSNFLNPPLVSVGKEGEP